MTILLPCLHRAFSRLCVLASKFPFSSKDTYLWIRTHPNDFILTWFHLQMPCFQIKSNSRYWGLGFGSGREWQGMIQPTPLSESLGAGWGKPAVSTAEVYDFRAHVGHETRPCCPSRLLEECTNASQENQQGISHQVVSREDHKWLQSSQRTPTAFPSLPSLLPSQQQAMPAGGGRNAGNRGCVPGVKDQATVPLPTEGPWATGRAAAEGVIRKDWALYEVDVLNWVRLNEALRNLSGHSELRFAQEVIWVGEKSSRNISGKTNPAAMPEGWAAPFLSL